MPQVVIVQPNGATIHHQEKGEKPHSRLSPGAVYFSRLACQTKHGSAASVSQPSRQAKGCNTSRQAQVPPSFNDHAGQLIN